MGRSAVVAKGGIVWFFLRGVIDYEEAIRIVDLGRKVVQSQPGKVRIYSDVTGSTGDDNRARKAIADSLKEDPAKVERIAVYTPDLRQRVLVKIVVSMSTQKNIKVFGKRSEALAWLQEGFETEVEPPTKSEGAPEEPGEAPD